MDSGGLLGGLDSLCKGGLALTGEDPERDARVPRRVIAWIPRELVLLRLVLGPVLMHGVRPVDLSREFAGY